MKLQNIMQSGVTVYQMVKELANIQIIRGTKANGEMDCLTVKARKSSKMDLIMTETGKMAKLLVTV